MASFKGVKTKMSADYFNKLPTDLWGQIILPKLSFIDQVRFAAVCRSWRSIAIESPSSWVHHNCRILPLPWLMISRDIATQTGLFLCLSESKLYNIKLSALASESYCCGSSQGYLVMANEDGDFLYDPFSQTHISLPKHFVPHKDCKHLLADLRHCYFIKVVLSPTPVDNTSDRLIVALCHNIANIETCRANDLKWSIFGIGIDKEEEEQEVVFRPSPCPRVQIDREEVKKWFRTMALPEKEYADIVFHKGLFYGLTQQGGLVSFVMQDSKLIELERLEVTRLSLSFPPETDEYLYGMHLVESCGVLLLVLRLGIEYVKEEMTMFKTIKFYVYKRDRSCDPVLRWVLLESLVDEMLFLGRNSSLSVSCKGIPGFKGNCIFFTDEYWPYFWCGFHPAYINSDNGVFYLDSGRIESFFPPGDSHSFETPPIWVTPPSMKLL